MLRSTPHAWTLALTAIAGLALLSPAAPAQEAEPAAVDLTPRWSDGQAATYQLTSDLVRELTFNFDGNVRNFKIVSKVTAQVTWTVTDADEEGGGDVTFRLKNISIERTATADGETETMKYSDSGGDEGTDEAQKTLAAMTDSDITLTVTADGQIKDLEGVAEMARAAGDDEQTTINDAYFRDIIRDIAVLPGGPAEAEPGATWQAESTGTHEAGELGFDETYEFVGVERIEGVPIAFVNRKSTMKFTPKKPEGGAAPDVDVNQAERASQFMFDLSRNEIIGANFDRVLELEASRNLGGRQMSQVIRETSNAQVLRIAESAD